MRLHSPSPPQGKNNRSLLYSLLPPHIQYSPPQGIGAVELGDPLLALFPPIADNTFQFYKFYQINNNQAAQTHTDMPLVIIDTLPAGIIQQASGFDIRAFDSSGGSVPYEVSEVTINPDTSADIIIWFKMAVVKDLEFIQLTFGKSDATDGSDPNAVYDANYTGVFHMNNTTFGSSSVKDSTSNIANGTPIGSGYTSVAGKIGKAIKKPITSGNRIGLPGNSLIVTDDEEFTLSAWVNPDVFSNLSMIFALGQFGSEVISFLNSSGIVRFLAGDFTPSTVTSPASAPIGIFTQVIVTLRNNDTIRIFVNGILTITQAVTGDIVFNASTRSIGGNQGADIFSGILDEIFCSNVARSPDYISTVFNNTNDNNAFWHKTPLLEDGVDNFLVDDQGRRIVAVQS